MKKVLAGILMCVIAMASVYVPSNAAAYSLSTTGSMKSAADAYTSTYLCWVNTEAQCVVKSTKATITYVVVSVRMGSNSVSKSAESLALGQKLKATKDIGYKTASISGSVSYTAP